MSQPLSPDYAVMRADVARSATEYLAQWLSRIANDTRERTEALAGGKTTFRNRFFRDLSGFPISDAMAESFWAFLLDIHARQHPGLSPKAVLDGLEVRETRPPTRQEIADAWRVESASSEEGRRQIYGPGGHPGELLDQLRRMDDDEE